MMFWNVVAMAPAQGQEQQSPVFMIGWLALMVLIFYFMLIRPQQRREKERRAMIEQIQSGDRVLFSGGIIGMVTNVKEKTFVIKIADGVKVEVLRAAVSRVLEKGEIPDDEQAG